MFGAAGRSRLVAIDSIEIVQPELIVLERFPQPARFPTIGRLLTDERMHHHFTDGRTFLRRTNERYDIIEADALRPTSAYSGNLYSVEYFELVRDRLAPGGLAVTWAPTRASLVVRGGLSVRAVFEDVAVGSSVTNCVRSRGDPGAVERTVCARALRGRARSTSLRRLRQVLCPRARCDSTPDSPRPLERDLNRDLFPRDEFGAGTEPISTD